MPPVLLSLVTWNSAAFVEACLTAALAQTYRDFELWVIDNDSQDDTCARVEALAATDPRLRLYRRPDNTGFCGGHNYALDHSDSAYVLLVNPDVVMQPDYLTRALAAIGQDERIGVVCGLLVQTTEADPTIDSAGMTALPDGRYSLRLHGQRLSSANLTAGYVDGADGALPLLRRHFINDLRVEGYFFDPRFFAHKEDWDIAWRGRLYGWRTWFEPACRALHPRQFLPGQLRLRTRLAGVMKQDAVKNQWMLLMKNIPRWQFLRILPRLLPRQLAIFAYSLLFERSSLPAFHYVWQNWQQIRHTRKLVQSRVRQGWQPAPHSPGMPHKPLLSICVPTYHRPELLARTLQSIGPLPPDVEVIVSDNSTDNDDCQHMAQRLLAGQPADQWHYYRNPPGSTIVDNFAVCVSRARGHYIYHLHDDDYLLPGGLTTMMRMLRHARDEHHVLVFGVELVDSQGRVMRHQTVRRRQVWQPAEALEQVLTNSSLIRMPAIVASKAAYHKAGGPDLQQGNTVDTDMWARIFAHHPVLRVPDKVAAYTIHEGAATSRMFTKITIGQLLRIFEKSEALLPQSRLRRAKAKFFHQFILAGTYRSLKQHDLASAQEIFRLFDEPSLRELSWPLRWLPLRLAFTALNGLYLWEKYVRYTPEELVP
ncbi:glycosyltransferase family 2 protein [Hymenobacter chitinivorans]|uniref:GT2 family glycosyltransferase n=1 Tax=Hymenobacter chitinivorans DSM 11115 TaxID=1121954 RepID=A0A2M9BP98_9BACT|nr:glycosyltransferase family 2 protein [Hymenobacter chitinivorans]PJJ59776.1 GT2 family glycosyltransferase [Hymenobacter chitinivorans DSM 11115]